MNRFEKGQLHSIIKCAVIDNIINEILENGKIDYESLSYSKKIIVCKMMKDKRHLYGRVIA